MDTGTAQRVDPDGHARRADRLHVDDIAEVGDIGTDIIVAVNADGLLRTAIRHSLHAPHLILQEGVGGALDHRRDIGVGRPAVRWIIFEAAILGRIVRRRDHHAIGKA